jgi:hypothetical protein
MRILAARKLVRAAVLSSISLSAAAPALAGIPTHIKPGFWQVVIDVSMSMTMMGQTMGEPDKTWAVFDCTDGSLRSVEDNNPAASGDCTNGSVTLTGNTLNAVIVCPGPIGMGGPLTIHETLMFPSDTAMHMEEDGASPNMTLHAIGNWTWLGACPPGANPGDMGTMVNGNFVKSSDN